MYACVRACVCTLKWVGLRLGHFLTETALQPHGASQPAPSQESPGDQSQNDTSLRWRAFKNFHVTYCGWASGVACWGMRRASAKSEQCYPLLLPGIEPEHCRMVCGRGDPQAGTARNAHGGAVTGIAIDSFNKVMGTAGADGWLRVWDFDKQTLLREVRVGAAVTQIAFHAVSGLISLACADLVIRMYVFPPSL